MNEWIVSGQRNIRQVIALVELSKIKCLLKIVLFSLSLSLNLELLIRSEWHTFSNEKSATDQSHVRTAVILYYLCHSINSQILNYQNS